MKSFVVALSFVAGCTFIDTSHGGSPHGDPDAADPAVHCSSQVFDGQTCDVHTDSVCDWSEGIDAGAALPVEHCVCRFDGKWKCQAQQYRSCGAGEYMGATCHGETPCEYPLEADAGVGNDIVCTCGAEGVWQCAPMTQ